MKKNISINIGGIIFHIDEDGYDQLKSYLDSINAYFSSFEDSKEIIDDIENRIAEILLGKLGEGKQVVTTDEIEELIRIMGTTADFEAAIETEPEEKVKVEADSEEKEKAESTQESTSQTAGTKRLYRDVKHRVFGGVAAGIAHYFGIDSLWIRLVFLALFFNILFWGLSGATFLAYIILWIVLPGNEELEEQKGLKKLFRNVEDRVLGGVSSGIAAYFGTDPTVIRLLFVLSIFLGGAGILLYIILWIITPEAKTITEKMQMQGEPVTLSNIESNVKKSLKVDEGEENLLVKILLFPFRLIALIINGLAEILGPLLKFLVEAFRIFFGAIVSLTGFSLAISFLIVFFVLLGIGGVWMDYIYIDDMPVDLLMNTINWLAASSIFLVFVIPAIALIFLGIVIIVKRRVGGAYVGWSLFGLWIIGLIGTAITIPAVVKDFRTENDYREEISYENSGEVPTLRLNENSGYSDYDGVRLQLRGHSDSTYKLLLRYESRGSSRADAENNAQAVTYTVNRDGDDFIFDSELDFSGAPFRFQEVNAILYIPFGQTFRMDGDMDEILSNTLHLNGYRSYQIEGNDWVFDRSGINCVTCESEDYDYRRRYDDRDEEEYEQQDRRYNRGEVIDYDFQDFQSVKIASSFDVRITKGSDYKVELYGDDASDANLVQYGDKLEIKYRDGWNWWENNKWDDLDLSIRITAPEIEEIELIGGCQGSVRGFDNEEIEINLTGASELDVNVDPRFLVVNLTGASKMTLVGEAEKFDTRLVGASRLNASDFRADYVTLDAIGASRAEVYGREEIDIRAAGVSSVEYYGTDNVSIDTDGLSSVKRDR